MHIGEPHQKKCGGKFIKIAEPEGYKKKIEPKRKNEEVVNGKIESFFKKSEKEEVKKENPKKRSKEEAGIT